MTSAATTQTSIHGLSGRFSTQAAARPTRAFLWTPDGSVTYGEADDRVEAYAAALQQRGIGAGDRVLLLMSNSATQVLLWLALDRIGAVNVPVNTALGPDLLARAVRTVRPALVVVDADLAEDLALALRGEQASRAVTYVHGDLAAARRVLPYVRPLLELSIVGGTVGRPALGDLDPAVMLFTSGSTGVPKACVLSRRYVVRAGELHVKYLGLRESDVLFTPFPLFHIDAATLTLSAAIAAGATAALSKRFSASRFWEEVRASGATVFNFMGATANILWKRPPSEEDNRHSVRMAWGVPMPACEPGWQDRFGFPLIEVYGLTDAGVPAYQDIDRPRVPGSCGRVIPEYELRIADEAGESVPTGQVGEILLRGREPGLLMTEYFRMPDETAKALRGGWFHTGDSAHLDDEGHLFFASRAKEVIRRRGENIAATDVEAAIDTHPDVQESAAVGVPSELSEDDIKVFIVPQPRSTLSPVDILEHCRAVLPKYMLPRYLEIVDELPKTPTEKIERARLAARPLTHSTWDASAQTARCHPNASASPNARHHTTGTAMSNETTREPVKQTDLIDGVWSAPAESLAGTLDDPNTGEVRQHQMATATDEVERAIAAAAALHSEGTWERTPVETRILLLERLADGLDRRHEEIGYEDAMGNGNPLHVAVQMASYLGPRVRSAASQLQEVGQGRALDADGRPVKLLRRPLGPAVVLAPWNAPTFVGVAKLASALAAGCPVILKPSEWAPAGSQIVAEVLAEAVTELGLPSAVFQLVHGGAAVGAQLVSDARVRAISFTGGGAGGRAVATAAAPHFTSLQLELGGHNPAIVLSDADVDLTAKALVDGMTKLNGQWCEAPGKVIVHQDVHDQLVDAILAQLATLTVGNCLEPGTDVGPLSHAAHRDHLARRVDELVGRGGKALTVHDLTDQGGWFFAPTVVVGLDADQSTAELFGPAISVHSVPSDEAAIDASDGPETGLAGFVFSSDVDKAMVAAGRVRAGEVRINGCKLADLADDSEQSFWNNAGIGGHGPTDMVRFFQGSQVVGLDDPELPI